MKPDGDGLNRLLRVCNDVVQQYGQPPLYVAPTPAEPVTSKNQKRKGVHSGRTSQTSSVVGEKVGQDVSDAFHVSIGWSLTAPSAEMEMRTKTLVEGKGFMEVKEMSAGVAEVKAKVGNVVTGITLPKAVVERKGLFGF